MGSHYVPRVGGKSPYLEGPAWACETAKGSKPLSLGRSLSLVSEEPVPEGLGLDPAKCLASNLDSSSYH